MVATKLRGQITADGKLIVARVPSELVPGEVEVIVLQQSASKLPRKRGTRKEIHPAFGMWAKREDIKDSAQFAEQLRQKLEKRT